MHIFTQPLHYGQDVAQDQFLSSLNSEFSFS